MRSPFKREPSDLQKPINTVLELMDQCEPESPEYKILVDRLDDLKKIERKNRPKRLSRDSLFQGACYVAGIVFIVGYEHGHVLGSKALGHLKKP